MLENDCKRPLGVVARLKHLQEVEREREFKRERERERERERDGVSKWVGSGHVSGAEQSPEGVQGLSLDTEHNRGCKHKHPHTHSHTVH